MKDDLYSEGGPVPTTPEEFGAEVQAIVLDPRIHTAYALDVQLGQLALGYADHVLGGLRLRHGPWDENDAWPHPCSQEEIERTGVDIRQPDGVPRDWTEKYPLHISLGVEPGTCLRCEVLPLGEDCPACSPTP